MTRYNESDHEKLIDTVVAEQRAYFKTGETLDLDFRKTMLHKLAAALKKWEKPIYDALWTDLHKSYEEALVTETSIVVGEIRNHLRHLSKWAARERLGSPLKLFPSSSYVVKEPLGNTLIVSPWNYPVQLLLNPLVGAISSGCTAILKPSPYVPSVSKAVAEMIEDTFDRKYIAVIQGHRDVNLYLFSKRFDLIFFTGSPSLGKTVMAAAAKTLTPVILELGGKSPCIVDADADIKVAATRIAWGKTLNSGQTCIAPDYLIIHSKVRDAFVKAFRDAVRKLHGDDVQNSRHYVRMVDDKAFDRVTSYLDEGKVLYGGRSDSEDRFIEPTLLSEVSLDSKVMTEEIFGPVFPIVEMDDADGRKFEDKVVEFVNSHEKPLAFYYFGKKKTAWEVIRRTSSGGACINDVIMHIANEKIPFGGVGNSGMGSYHGKYTFDAFSHKRSVVSTGTAVDLPFRYMPYKWLFLLKNIL